MDDTPHTVQEVMCVKCLHRWIAVVPCGTPLKDLECAGCGRAGAAINTGEEMPGVPGDMEGMLS